MQHSAKIVTPDLRRGRHGWFGDERVEDFPGLFEISLREEIPGPEELLGDGAVARADDPLARAEPQVTLLVRSLPVEKSGDDPDDDDKPDARADERVAPAFVPATRASARIDPELPLSHLLDPGDDFVIALKAVRRSVGHHFFDEAYRQLRETGCGRLQIDDAFFNLLEFLHRGGVRLEGRLSGEGVIERRAEAVDVAFESVGIALELFRRHVKGRCPEILGLILTALLHREAEIDELRRALAGHEHVAGLDVAMDEVFPKRRLEPVRHVEGDREDFGLGEGAFAGDEFLQAGRVDHLHRDEKIAVIISHGVDLDHIRMHDRGGQLRLALEHGGQGAVPAERLVQDLQRHFAAEIHVHGAEDLAHPALAEQAHDLVLAHRRAHPHGGGAVRALDLRKGRHPRHVERFSALGTVINQRSFFLGFFHVNLRPRTLPFEEPTVYRERRRGPDNS